MIFGRFFKHIGIIHNHLWLIILKLNVLFLHPILIVKYSQTVKIAKFSVKLSKLSQFSDEGNS